MWDFRGIQHLNLERQRDAVLGTVTRLRTFWIQSTSGGWDENTYEPIGLVTEEDYALLDDLWKAQKERRFLKPLFWVTAWLVPLLALLVAGVAVVELLRWIGRGFRRDAPKEESQLRG